MILVSLSSGRLLAPGEDPSGDRGPWVPALEAEPHFTQTVGSEVDPKERSADGRFDKSHLAPEKVWRIGRDFIAHCIRYAYPMKVIRENFGAGARIVELGCGKDLATFRTITMDHGAVRYYKPVRYVGVDLNPIMYKPVVTGIDTLLLERTNIVDEFDKIPDEVFDLVVSWEVIEHMGKDDGNRFLDAAVKLARRKAERENKPGMILLSTPVNNGNVAKNHIYEWHLGELRRAWNNRGCHVLAEYGTFADLSQLLPVLTREERVCWNQLAAFHSPHTLSAMFSANHPEAARNVVWNVLVEP